MTNEENFDELVARVRKAVDDALKEAEKDIADFDAENAAHARIGSSAKKQKIYSDYAKGLITMADVNFRIGLINEEINGPSVGKRVKYFFNSLLDAILPPKH